MRITNALFYQNSINDYQKSMKSLYDVNAQMASGQIIQNSYDDSGIYVDAMRLEYEISTLDQVKETTSKAQTFANNTDEALNQFSDQLTQFKTKLLQAANASNSTTSLNAVADELESIKQGLIALSNTSINGQYLFSGTAFSTKPISVDGSYNGNDEDINALIGSGVKLPYNITGYDLLLNKDNDYNRVVSTNVAMFNQTKLYPDIMSDVGSSPSEVYLSETDTIRDMIGDNDSDSTNDSDAVFYVSGTKSDGATFSIQVQISPSSKVSDLLDSIGTAYGNTSTNQVVNVSLNAHGQIEIKDLTKGNTLLDFNIFGAVDRNVTSTDPTWPTGNALQSNIDDLVGQTNVDIISFDSSDYTNQNTASVIASREDIYDNGIYNVGYSLTDSDGDNATATSLLQDIMGSDVSVIVLDGTDSAGNAVNYSLTVVGTTTVQDLLSQIETSFSDTAGDISARVEDGQIVVESSTGTFSMTLSAYDSSAASVDAFSTADSMNYTRRGLEKDGNELLGNISQVVKDTNEFATASTKLIDVAGTDTLDGTQYTLNGVDKNGNDFTAQIDFSNSGTTFTLNGTTYDLYDADGNATPADEMTYQQLMDVVSMATSGIAPSDTDSSGTISQDEYNAAVKSAQKNVEVTLDYRGRLQIDDTTKSESNIELAMYDSKVNDFTVSTGSALSFMANNAVVVEDPYIDLFSDLDDMIEAVRNGQFRMDSDGENPRNLGIQNALARLDHIADHVTKQHTKIGAYSNAMANANERAQLLSVNVKTVKSDILDVDTAEAYLQLQQISASYQAMLSTVSKINSMSLLNYM